MDLVPYEVLGLVVLLLLDLYTVVFRSALTNASLARLLSLREEMEAQVNRTVDLLHAPRYWLAASGLILLLTRFLAAALLLVLFAPQTWTAATVLVEAGVLVLAAFLVFWIEWVAQTLVTRNAETWAMRLAPSVRALTVILAPLLVIPLAFSRKRGPNLDLAGTVTEQELKSMVDAGQEGGVLEQEERQMIYSIFDLGETLVREIMLPRIYITALEVSTPLPVAIDALVQSGHSRVPVYEEGIDHILGMLYAKDLLKIWGEGGQNESLRPLLRPAYFVPEAKKVDELLSEMQAGRVHMAIVVDEYGGIAGLVTLEDIMEEIIGEIHDEYDQSEEPPYVKVGEGEFIFQGRISLGDFNEVMESSVPDDMGTLSGLIYGQVGRVPASGESLQVGDILLTVEQVIGRRIHKVRAKRLAEVSDLDEGDGNHAE